MATEDQKRYNPDGKSGSVATEGGYTRRFVQGISNIFTGVKDMPSYVRSISDIGIDFSLIGKKTKIGISKKDMEDSDADAIQALLPKDEKIDDTSVPYFKKKYIDRIKYLNLFATHPEIEFILNQVCDEMIVYDQNGYFCNLSLTNLNMKDEPKNKIEKNFKKMYTLFGFNDGITAWLYALQWLIEGYLSFEIIYDDPTNPKRIIGFEELRPETLVPMIKEIEVENGNGEKRKKKIKVWKQVAVKGGKTEERILQDNQVIFIAWNWIPGQKGRISYCERLVRSFNLMRTMENTKVGWHIMNSQFRLKMVIPVGTKTTAKAKQALAQVTNRYKEDLLIDHESGEVTVNGQAKINFGRNIVLPSRQGQTPDIDGIQYRGPNLGNMEGVKYFERKLWRDSNVPYSRFDREGGSGRTILFNADGFPYDELNFYKFINRGRKEFEKILRIPTYLQTIMDMPELKIDLELKSKLGIHYDSNSLIEEAKEQEIENQKINNIQNMERLSEIDGRTPIFSKKYLFVNKYGVMTDEEWDENKRLRDEELQESKDRGGDSSSRW